MLFHEPDASFATLKSCWKRAAKFAAPGKIEPSHPLAAAWANCEMMVDAEDSGKRYMHAGAFDYAGYLADEKERVEACTFSISCLDWFAQKLDEYSKTHMLDGDANISAMLHEWRSRMMFDPECVGIPEPPVVEKKAKPKKDALTIQIEKENSRVMYEWDAFHKKHGDVQYALLTEEAKDAACALAEKQGLRHRKIFGPLTIEG